MVRNKIVGRIKAALVSTAMIATTLITPAVSTFNNVTAASQTINVNKTFTTTESETAGTNKGDITLSNLGAGVKTLTLNFETSYTGNCTIGVYGWGLAASPYWADDKQQVEKTVKDGKLAVTFTIPTTITSTVTKIGMGIWYPKAGETFKLTTIETDAAGGTEQETPDIPVSANAKSGTCTFKDNGDGTATISSTLTAEIDTSAEAMNYLLTAGYDEEMYDPSVNPDAEPYVPGESPINSHKFKFSEFGISDIKNVTFESFNYTIESDVDIKRFLYGGGINVQQGSVADTEAVKGKNGYWYNDQGEEDVAEYGDKFLIDDYHEGYTATGLGSYGEIVWDVPKSVQPFVTKNESDAVGFQFWYAEENAEESPAVEEVHLTSASCTYTRTMTVPYNKTISKTLNKTLTSGSDTTNQTKFSLADLNLGERDKLSAVKFTVSSTTDLHKFTSGLGISVDSENVIATDGWYQPSNVVVLDGGKSFEIMWIIPESIRNDLYTQEGDVMFGFWYGGDKAGEEATSITLKSMDFYTFASQEEELLVTPSELEIVAGETEKLTVNVDGCTFVPLNKNVVTVDENGNVTAVAEGATTITVTTPEGQVTTVNVTVLPPVTTAVTTVVTTTTTTVVTTTTAVTTTVDPDEIIDWDYVLYGDVNLDQKISSADVVALNKYLVNKTAYALKNATARENADCKYDTVLSQEDSVAIINFCLEKITKLDLGPAEKPVNKFYSN